MITSNPNRFNDDGVNGGIETQYLLEQYCDASPHVSEYSYITFPTVDAIRSISSTEINNIGRIASFGTKLYGGSPNLLDISPTIITKVASQDSSFPAQYTLSEEMFTVKGSYSTHMGIL